jgi:hypothetical protein
MEREPASGTGSRAKGRRGTLRRNAEEGAIWSRNWLVRSFEQSGDLDATSEGPSKFE